MHVTAPHAPSALFAALPALVAALLSHPVGFAQAVLTEAERAPSPFREPIRVLYTIDGAGAGEQFGWVARALGDVDGDGAVDFAATAPFAGGGAGRVDVHSGRTGERLFRFEGRPGDLVGWVVGPAGDLDGDGRPEIAVGAPGAPAVPATASAAGRPGRSGRVVVLRAKDGAVWLDVHGSKVPDRFGEDVAPAPDLDGDGRGELVIGAPKCAEGGADAGAVFVHSGATGERLAALRGASGALFGNSVACTADARILAVTALNGGEGQRGEVHVFGLPGLAPLHVVRAGEGAQNLGWFLSLVPDRDADGVHEVYATDWHHARVAGRALVTSGADGAVLLDIVGERPGLGFGIGVAGRDDFDGDGVHDPVVGAWLDATHGQQCGRVDVRSGKDGALLGRVTGTVPGAVLGFDADTLGDVDGDGVPEVLVTAAYHAARGDKTGRVYVLSGASIVRQEAHVE